MRKWVKNNKKTQSTCRGNNWTWQTARVWLLKEQRTHEGFEWGAHAEAISNELWT